MHRAGACGALYRAVHRKEGVSSASIWWKSICVLVEFGGYVILRNPTVTCRDLQDEFIAFVLGTISPHVDEDIDTRTGVMICPRNSSALV